MSDVGQESAPHYLSGLRPLPEARYRECRSLEELINKFFGQQFGALSLLDIGTGTGEFPLRLARIKKLLGLEDIVVIDKDLSYAEDSGNAQRLRDLNVKLEKVDVKQSAPKQILWVLPVDPSPRLFDIVCLNAPYIGSQWVC